MDITKIQPVPYAKLLDFIIRVKNMGDKLVTKCVLLYSHHFIIRFPEKGANACTSMVSDTTRQITICKPLVAQIVGQMEVDTDGDMKYKDVPFTEFGSVATDTIKSILGLFYHECLHNEFTNMTKEVWNKVASYPDFIYYHQLNNILEDICIERVCCRGAHPGWVKFLEYNESRLFKDTNSKYERDDISVASFYNFLLFKLRAGKAFTGSHKVWDEHQAELTPMIKGFLLEKDPDKRVQRSIDIVDWLKANTELDFTAEKGDGDGEEYTPTFIDGQSGSKSPEGGTDDDPMMPNPNGRGGGGEPTSEMPPLLDQDFSDCKMNRNDMQEAADIFSDTDAPAYPHQWWDAKSTYAPQPEAEFIINRIIQQNNGMALQCKVPFQLLKARTRPVFESGYSRGKFNTQIAMKKKIKGETPIKVFDQIRKNGNQPDVAVSFLCDLSGSMSGHKSKMCCEALTTLAYACELAGIPTEINAFSDTYQADTIHIKDFEDSFAKSKKYLGILDYDILSSFYDRQANPAFMGNYDEVNIYYVWKKLLHNKHRDKLLIVLSDGATSGDKGELMALTRKIEQSGIGVIGIGIRSNCVKDGYDHVQVFDDSLDGLPDFLRRTVLQFAKERSKKQ